jgi:hypothetical protein
MRPKPLLIPDVEIEPGQNDIIILAVAVCIDQMAHRGSPVGRTTQRV